MARTSLDYGPRPGAADGPVRQGGSHKLVWTQRIIAAVWAIDHVVEIAAVRVPKALEAGRGVLGQRVKRLWLGYTQVGVQPVEHTQRVDPQGIDLHWFPDARGHHPIAHLGIHPGELHSCLTRI